MDNLTRDYFDANAAYWHDVYFDLHTFTGHILRRVHDAVLDAVTEQGGMCRILDAGCGAGVTAAALAAKNHAVSAFDIAPEMVAQATQTASSHDTNVALSVAHARVLPYRSDTFDVVIALGLLSNLRDDETALHEIQRVLRPGGLLLATVANVIALDVMLALPGSLPILLNTTPLRRPARIAANVLRKLIGRPAKNPDAIRFGRSVIPPLYMRRLEKAGFVDVRYTALGFGPLVPFGLWRLPDAQSIAFSESLVRRHAPALTGSAVLYRATRL